MDGLQVGEFPIKVSLAKNNLNDPMAAARLGGGGPRPGPSGGGPRIGRGPPPDGPGPRPMRLPPPPRVLPPPDMRPPHRQHHMHDDMGGPPDRRGMEWPLEDRGPVDRGPPDMGRHPRHPQPVRLDRPMEQGAWEFDEPVHHQLSGPPRATGLLRPPDIRTAAAAARAPQGRGMPQQPNPATASDQDIADFLHLDLRRPSDRRRIDEYRKSGRPLPAQAAPAGPSASHALPYAGGGGGRQGDPGLPPHEFAPDWRRPDDSRRPSSSSGGYRDFPPHSAGVCMT